MVYSTKYQRVSEENVTDKCVLYPFSYTRHELGAVISWRVTAQVLVSIVVALLAGATGFYWGQHQLKGTGTGLLCKITFTALSADK